MVCVQCSVRFADTHGSASCLIPAESLTNSEGVLLNFLPALCSMGATLNFSSIRHSPKEFLFSRQEWGEEMLALGQILLFLAVLTVCSGDLCGSETPC